MGTDNMPIGDSGFKYMPVLYTERKGAYEKSYLTLPTGCDEGQCQSIYAYDATTMWQAVVQDRRPPFGMTAWFTSCHDCSTMLSLPITAK